LYKDLDEIHLDTTFKYLMNVQLNNLFMYLINNEYKYKNECARYSYAQAIQKCLLLQLQLQLDRKQLDNDVFNYLVNELEYDSSNNAQYSYAKSFGRMSSQLNEAWKGLNNKLDDKKEDIRSDI
ncbi:hypothetical protein RFI_35537, partial [Reticulomyxa filosa]